MKTSLLEFLKDIRISIDFNVRSINTNTILELIMSESGVGISEEKGNGNNDTSCNMQTDSAAFESWALIIKAVFPEIKVSLNWKGNPIKNENNGFTTHEHYNRFLFRVMSFKKEYSDWFFVHEDKIDEIVIFESMFSSISKQNKFINNIPQEEGNISKTDDSNSKMEHFIERTFCLKENSKKYLIDLTKEVTNGKLSNVNCQLPVGLFNKYDCSKTCFHFDVGEKCQDNKYCKKRRVFTGGSSAIDLWGIDSVNNLNIFELKKAGNISVGIISELFFYANFCKLVFIDNNYNRFGNRKNHYRGYDVLQNSASKGINNVNAFFLTDDLHKSIKNNMDSILRLLNKNSATNKISYNFISYDFSRIEDDLNCLKKDVKQDN